MCERKPRSSKRTYSNVSPMGDNSYSISHFNDRTSQSHYCNKIPLRPYLSVTESLVWNRIRWRIKFTGKGHNHIVGSLYISLYFISADCKHLDHVLIRLNEADYRSCKQDQNATDSATPEYHEIVDGYEVSTCLFSLHPLFCLIKSVLFDNLDNLQKILIQWN